MNISPNTLKILRNFAEIVADKDASSILIEAGNEIHALAPHRGVLASAQVPETFPVPFAIYDLNELLMAISLLESPVFEFAKAHVIIKEERGEFEIRYGFADPSLITAPSQSVLEASKEFDSKYKPEIAFSLSEDQCEAILKAARLFHAPELAVVSDGAVIQFMTFDTKNSSTNILSMRVGPGNGTQFKMVVDVDFLNLLKGPYRVKVSSKGYARLSHQEMNLNYFIALDAGSSKYGGK